MNCLLCKDSHSLVWEPDNLQDQICTEIHSGGSWLPPALLMTVRDHRCDPWCQHVCLFWSRGYATKHVVEGLEPRTLYRFRLKVTSPSGEYAYSPVVTVSTTSE